MASASIPPDALPATFSRHALAFCILGDDFAPGASIEQGEFALRRFDVLGVTEGNGAEERCTLRPRENLPPAACCAKVCTPGAEDFPSPELNLERCRRRLASDLPNMVPPKYFWFASRAELATDAATALPERPCGCAALGQIRKLASRAARSDHPVYGCGAARVGCGVP